MAPDFGFPGSARDLRVGEQLVALGSPLGTNITASAGVLGSKAYLIDDETLDRLYVRDSVCTAHPALTQGGF